MRITDRTPAEWEVELGTQLRRARIAADLDQHGLAARANISVGALRALEQGKGSTVRTLVRVVRGLRREDWLESLEPKPEIDPLMFFRTGDRDRERQRVARRKNRSGVPRGDSPGDAAIDRTRVPGSIPVSLHRGDRTS